MSTKTSLFLKVLHVISWIIFIGVCFEAGALITQTIVTLWYTPAGANRFWKPVDLTGLYHFNQTYYVTLTSIMIIVAVMRAWMFYLIVKIFSENKINLSQPFNEGMKLFIERLAYFAIGIGLFSYWGAKFTENLVTQGVTMPGLQYLRIAGADVWLFMGVILLIITQFFKKGIDIQNENDLTV